MMTGNGEQMLVVADPAGESTRRDQVAGLVASDRKRLRWRHLLVLAPSLAIMTVCGLGVAGSVWVPVAHRLGVGRHRLSELVPTFVAVYFIAALVAAWAWARFNAGRAVFRIPAVVVFGAVGIVVLVLTTLVQLPSSGGEGGASSGSTGEPSSEAGLATIASVLVNRDEAAAMLGASVGPADMSGRLLLRGSSLCRYRALDRSATLTVTLRRVPRRTAVERLMRRGDPVSGVGDAAVVHARGVIAVSGQWMLALTVYRRDGRAQDREALVEGIRLALGRLPLGSGAAASAVFTSALGGVR